MEKKVIYRIRNSVRGIEGAKKYEYSGHGGQRPGQWWLAVNKLRKKAVFESVEEATEAINEFEKNKGRAYEITVLSTEDEAAMKPVKAAKTPKVKKSTKVENKKSVKLPTTKRSKKIEVAEPEEDSSVTSLADQVAKALEEECKVA